MIYEVLYRQQVRISGVYRKALLAAARLFARTNRGGLAREILAALAAADARVEEIRKEKRPNETND